MWVLDGNINDIITLAVAGSYAAARSFAYRRERPLFEGFVSDLSYGVSIYPMFLLTCVAFSSTALNNLTESNKVLMSLSGLISLVVIVKRSFETRITPVSA